MNCDGNHAARCTRCERALDFDFTMAFQPIIDIEAGRPFAYEALVRGPAGESAYSILSKVDGSRLYSFDQACRVRAIELAHALGCTAMVSINFLPNAVYEPETCIQATLKTAAKVGWPQSQLMFEIIETEAVTDREHMQNIVESYRAMGFTTALDDFGSGHANLDLLVELRPDVIKLDRELVREINDNPRRRILVETVVWLAGQLDIRLVAEGVETVDEAAWLYYHGIRLQQGYYFARPGLEQLPVCTAERLAAVRG